jgi:RNA polymerase sigma-70 factor (ECF subfamily)
MSTPRAPAETEARLQPLVEQARRGDRAARDQLIHHACDRLLTLTRRMLRCHPGVSRWEQTDDVFQNAMVRLHRALETANLVDVRHFINLATLQIRRELIDLGRKHFGPEGIGRNHHTDHRPPDDPGGPLDGVPTEPLDLDEWTAFHEAAATLPEEEREVVDLLFYDGMSHDEAANVLGCSVRTVRRRWQDARVHLHERLTDGFGSPPDPG